MKSGLTMLRLIWKLRPRLAELIVLCGIVTCGVSGTGSNQFSMSCEKAAVPTGLKWCKDVIWRSARLYNDQEDETEINPAVFQYVDEVVRETIDAFMMNTTYREERQCKALLKQYLCATNFPHCPFVGSGAEYQVVCRKECLNVEKGCGPIPGLNCTQAPESNCFLIPRKSYFFLPDEKGPYVAMPYLYASLFVLWCVSVGLWVYITMIRYGIFSTVLTRYLTLLPICKAVVMAACFVFWSSCQRWQHCSFWFGMACITTQLVFNSAVYFSMIVVGKGWGITVDRFSRREWRQVTMLITIFYLLTTLLHVLRRTGLDEDQTVIVAWSAYSLIYVAVFAFTLQNVFRLRNQVAVAEFHAIPPAYHSFRQKYCIMKAFLIGVCVYGSMEVLSNRLQKLYKPIWVSIFFREACDLIVTLFLGYIFKPEQHNIYYYMMPHQSTEFEVLPPIYSATLDVNPSTGYDICRQQSPGMTRKGHILAAQGSIVVIQHPGNELMIGVQLRETCPTWRSPATPALGYVSRVIRALSAMRGSHLLSAASFPSNARIQDLTPGSIPIPAAATVSQVEGHPNRLLGGASPL